ncbi:hypothetical protein [Coraliomargarita parva]|uniref:hypothetical protein n=1 Tax=Coraliomargarita parva TaxID=3014050 RepID=UPI0022B45934|nr:hypothetical protein [Coraliomargarita parva]
MFLHRSRFLKVLQLWPLWLFAATPLGAQNLSLVIDLSDSSITWGGSLESLVPGALPPPPTFGLFATPNYSLELPDLLAQNISDINPPASLPIDYILFDVDTGTGLINGLQISPGALLALSPIPAPDTRYQIIPGINSLTGDLGLTQPSLETILNDLSLGDYTLSDMTAFWSGGINISVVPEAKQYALTLSLLSLASLCLSRRRR